VAGHVHALLLMLQVRSLSGAGASTPIPDALLGAASSYANVSVNMPGCILLVHDIEVCAGGHAGYHLYLRP
jgi:hypothetical protein